MNFGKLIACAGLALFTAGCVTSQVENVRGTPTVYQDPGSGGGPVTGVGIEPNDIIAMTDKMIRSMLAEPRIASRATAPRVVVDDEHFDNLSTSTVSTSLLTSRLRSALNRAARGKMVFMARHRSDMVAQERQLKRDGAVDGGTIRQTAATGGADYRLAGTIESQDRIDPRTQTKVRYTFVTFELIDLELGDIAWTDYYEVEKASQDNVLYR